MAPGHRPATATRLETGMRYPEYTLRTPGAQTYCRPERQACEIVCVSSSHRTTAVALGARRGGWVRGGVWHAVGSRPPGSGEGQDRVKGKLGPTSGQDTAATQDGSRLPHAVLLGRQNSVARTLLARVCSPDRYSLGPCLHGLLSPVLCSAANPAGPAGL